MKVRTLNGTEVDIPESEVARIRGETSHAGKKLYSRRNHERMNKAIAKIHEETGMRPECMEDLEHLLYRHFYFGSEEKTCLLAAILSAMMALHTKEIHEED